MAVIVVSVDRFTKESSTVSAAALTFYSTLAFIPLVAVFLAIARGFGADIAFQNWLKDQSYTNPEVMQWVMDFAAKALDNTKNGLIAGLGIVLLLWSVIRVLSNAELAMNRIWGVKKGRGLVKKFTDYMSVLFIASILMIIVSSLNVFMMSNLQTYAAGEGFWSYAGAALKAVLTLLPYVLVWFLFVFLYMFVPTTPVKFKYALLAGMAAGTIFQLVQWGYIRFQVGVVSYNAIYGGLAALPLLLVWLQLSWCIVLWGTELCYVMRNRHFLYRNAFGSGRRWVDQVGISVRILKFISGQYRRDCGGPTLSMICKRLRMSTSRARSVLQELADNHILVEVREEDDVSYYPALDFHRLALSDVITRLSFTDDNRGEEWKTRFVEAIKREFSKDTFA